LPDAGSFGGEALVIFRFGSLVIRRSWQVLEPDDPSSASLIAGRECKFYPGNLQKVLGRAFVGLIDDMGTNLRLSGLCSNSTHSPLREHFRPQRCPHPHFGLTPLQPSNQDIFVNQIKGELEKMTAS
jgi:hypothetical protein